MRDAYANAAFIPGGDAFVALWQAKAAAFRAAHPPRVLRYGPRPRNAMDLFAPARPKGLMVFLHGGFWMETDRSLWSHLAAGALAEGWAVAMPSYTLAPEARVGCITTEVLAALRAATVAVPGPVVLCGHSAGAQLAAMVATRVAVDRAVLISPLGDLRPLMDDPMNAVLRLDAAEAAAQSPVDHRPLCPVHVHVGEQERPAFLWQARLLAEVWGCSFATHPGRHHFDVIAGLEAPSPLLRSVLQG